MRQLKGVKSIFESVLKAFQMLKRKLIHLIIQRHKNRKLISFPVFETLIVPYEALVEENYYR